MLFKKWIILSHYKRNNSQLKKKQVQYLRLEVVGSSLREYPTALAIFDLPVFLPLSQLFAVASTSKIVIIRSTGLQIWRRSDLQLNNILLNATKIHSSSGYSGTRTTIHTETENINTHLLPFFFSEIRLHFINLLNWLQHQCPALHHLNNSGAENAIFRKHKLL